MSIGAPYRDDRDTRNRPRVDSIAINVTTNPQGIQKQLGFFARGLIVDNLTNQWLFCREITAFIPPYTSGRQIPLNGAQNVTITFQTPVGFTQQTIIAQQLAQCTFTEAPVSPSPGVPVAPGATRWEIDHEPATAVQASVTKAGVAGVIHVADFMHFKMIATVVTSHAQVPTFLRDGAAGVGTIIFGSSVSTTDTQNSADAITAGPLLGYRGTIGNAMTIELSAGAAGNVEKVDLIGYDS